MENSDGMEISTALGTKVLKVADNVHNGVYL